MTPHLLPTLESILREPTGVPAEALRERALPAEVAVECTVPDTEWRSALLAPTLCFYMFEMTENSEFRNATTQTSRANGVATVRQAPRRVDLRFLVCAFAGDAHDEQALVWRAMALLITHPVLPADRLPAQVQLLGLAVQTKVGPYQDAPRLLDLWGALDLPPRPALLYTVTWPLDLHQELTTPLVLSRTLRTLRPAPDDERQGLGLRPARIARRHGVAAGYAPRPGVVEDGALNEHGRAVAVDGERFVLAGRVCERGGHPVERAVVLLLGRSGYARTDRDGAFVLGELPAGPLVLRVRRPGEPLESPPGVAPPRPDLAVECPWPFDILLLT
jgi:hypothetical protein